jgi:hypothetical protein
MIQKSCPSLEILLGDVQVYFREDGTGFAEAFSLFEKIWFIRVKRQVTSAGEFKAEDYMLELAQRRLKLEQVTVVGWEDDMIFYIGRDGSVPRILNRPKL